MDLLQKLYLQYLLTWKKCNFKEFILIHLLPKEKKKIFQRIHTFTYLQEPEKIVRITC